METKIYLPSQLNQNVWQVTCNHSTDNINDLPCIQCLSFVALYDTLKYYTQSCSIRTVNLIWVYIMRVDYKSLIKCKS